MWRRDAARWRHDVVRRPEATPSRQLAFVHHDARLARLMCEESSDPAERLLLHRRREGCGPCRPQHGPNRSGPDHSGLGRRGSLDPAGGRAWAPRAGVGSSLRRDIKGHLPSLCSSSWTATTRFYVHCTRLRSSIRSLRSFSYLRLSTTYQSEAACSPRTSRSTSTSRAPNPAGPSRCSSDTDFRSSWGADRARPACAEVG